MTSPTQHEVSVERREQILRVLDGNGARMHRTYSAPPYALTVDEDVFWSFIAALDAQAKAEADARVAETQTVAFQAQEMAKEIASNADARVEAMRERCAKIAERRMPWGDVYQMAAGERRQSEIARAIRALPLTENEDATVFAVEGVMVAGETGLEPVTSSLTVKRSPD